MIPKIKKKLRNFHSLRSAYYFSLSVKDCVLLSKESRQENWCDDFYETPDPWNYLTHPEERARFQSAVRMLDEVQKGKLFENAFEIGCSEGVFTEMLAPRCKSLLAVDVSKRALQRAGERCAGMNVTFRQWNLIAEPAPSDMDLVIVMDVLEIFYCRSDIRKAREKVVNAVKPGGYVLVGNSRQNELYENAHWAKWMLKGGKRIAEYFAEHPRLTLVSTETQGLFINALFRAK